MAGGTDQNQTGSDSAGDLKEEQGMEVRLTPSIEQVIPPQISFNFEEIKAELSGKLQVYRNMVVTEDGIKEAKADRANLNKFKMALSDSRKSVKRQWNQPLTDFEDKMKELEQMVDAPIGAIDRQIKAFDEIKKQEKRQTIEEFFAENIGDLKEILPIAKIWNERWLNVTYSMKEIEKEIMEKIRKAHSDIRIIRAMQLPCTEQMISTYLDTLDMSAAMEEKHRYEEAQKAKAQLEKQKQAEPEVAKPEPVTVEPERVAEEPKVSEQQELRVLDFRVWVTPEQMKALKTFLIQNHIRYGRVQ